MWKPEQSSKVFVEARKVNPKVKTLAVPQRLYAYAGHDAVVGYLLEHIPKLLEKGGKGTELSDLESFALMLDLLLYMSTPVIHTILPLLAAVALQTAVDASVRNAVTSPGSDYCCQRALIVKLKVGIAVFKANKTPVRLLRINPSGEDVDANNAAFRMRCR